MRALCRTAVFSTVNEEGACTQTPTSAIRHWTFNDYRAELRNSFELITRCLAQTYQRGADFKLVSAPVLPITLAANASL